MSYKLQPSLGCDVVACDAEFRVGWQWIPCADGRTRTDATDIRREARSAGWRRQGRYDVCPKHPRGRVEITPRPDPEPVEIEPDE